MSKNLAPWQISRIADAVRSMMPFAAMRLKQKPSGGGGSPPTRGNSTKKQGGGTTAGITTTGGAGSVMLVFIGCASGATPSITDSNSNTWVAQWSQVGSGAGDRMLCWSCSGGTGGAGHTVTESGGGGADIIMFVEYTGCTGVELATSVDDVASPFAHSTGSTTVANSVVVSQGSPSGVASTTTMTCTPATVFLQETDFATYWAFAIADETVSTTGVKTETWTASTTPTTYVIGIIVVKGT